MWRRFESWLFLLIILVPGILPAQAVIRFNQLGYTPSDYKIVVAASKDASFRLKHYTIQNLLARKTVVDVRNAGEKDYGRFGPFEHSYRINISAIEQPGLYQLVVNDSIHSDTIRIAHDVYKGTADFCLQFLRKQRCNLIEAADGSNLHKGDFDVSNQSHDSSDVNVQGGWHNAGDNSQDVLTAAAVTGYLLSAYNDYPSLFNDSFDGGGNPGKNEKPDIADEIRWGFDWLIKMHPSRDQLFRQVGEWQLPNNRKGDSANTYAASRRVYSVTDTGNLFKTADVPRLAAFLSSVFSFGSQVITRSDASYADRLAERAVNTYQLAIQSGLKTGHNSLLNGMLASAAAGLSKIKPDKKYLEAAKTFNISGISNINYVDSLSLEPTILMNFLSNPAGKLTDCFIGKSSVSQVWQKAQGNAFYYGLPFINGSNRIVVSLALQCHNYKDYCTDSAFIALEQASMDWLFGCNPWGVTMVTGFPAPNAVSEPFNIHATDLVSGGLVNGPVVKKKYQSATVSSSIKNDKYIDWQSNTAVYHDDKADYSTNQPTIAGTAAIIYLLAGRESKALATTPNGFQLDNGAIIRGDSAKKRVALIFIGEREGAGMKAIPKILSKEKVLASFFPATEILRSAPAFVKALKAGGHYIGPFGNLESVTCNSNCSELFAPETFGDALQQNLQALKTLGITPLQSPVLLAPNEKYNQQIAAIATPAGFTLINHTSGTISLDDNSIPGDPGYFSSDSIFQNITAKARQMPYGLNGYFLVFHTDAAPARTDKFYLLLPLLLQDLRNEGYEMVRVDEMLGFKRPTAVKKKVKARLHKAVPVKKKKHRR